MCADSKTRRQAEYERAFDKDERRHVSDNIEFDDAFEKGCRLSAIKEAVAELNSSKAFTPLDIESRNRQLRELEKERRAITDSEKDCANLSENTKQQAEDKFPKVTQHKRGGRPNSPLREAVEFAYNQLKSTDSAVYIQQGHIASFMQYLRECITEGKSNESAFIAERIKAIKKVNGKWQITMQALTQEQKIVFATEGKHQRFIQNNVSKILTSLRQQERKTS